jgi:hypothetical protein
LLGLLPHHNLDRLHRKSSFSLSKENLRKRRISKGVKLEGRVSHTAVRKLYSGVQVLARVGKTIQLDPSSTGIFIGAVEKCPLLQRLFRVFNTIIAQKRCAIPIITLASFLLTLTESCHRNLAHLEVHRLVRNYGQL